MTPGLRESLAWAADGAAHLRGLMGRMGDEAFRAPSALPGWTRGHVLTHVARNADHLITILDGARTGTHTIVHTDPQRRDAEIEAGAARPPAEIREDVVTSSDRLARTVRAMPEEAWSAQVEVAPGRLVRAAEIPWWRAREVWVHSVDLDVGASFADFPRPMLRALVSEAVGTFTAQGDGPALLLIPIDTDHTWRVGNGSNPIEVRGSTPAIAAWLLGRSRGKDLRTPGNRPLPTPPRWL